jgi:hypothetical protein
LADFGGSAGSGIVPRSWALVFVVDLTHCGADPKVRWRARVAGRPILVHGERDAADRSLIGAEHADSGLSGRSIGHDTDVDTHPMGVPG